MEKFQRKGRRILITRFSKDFIPEVIDHLLQKKEIYIFLGFAHISEIHTVQHQKTKKRIIPILLDKGHGDGNQLEFTDFSDDVLMALPNLDFVLNSGNSSLITKFYEKRKHFNLVELKLHKTTPNEVNEVIDSSQGPTVLNLVPEGANHIGLTHIFDNDGLDIPLTAHLGKSLRNSIRKIFPAKKYNSTQSLGDHIPCSSNIESIAVGDRSKSARFPQTESHPQSRQRTQSLTRSFSFLRKKKSNERDSSGLDKLQRELWTKESASYFKSLNKLHSESISKHKKSEKKLHSKRAKREKAVEKLVEEEMRREKNVLDSKNIELNAVTMARSTALTPDTANRIIASREARVNKEVCRNANKKKNEEFQKIQQNHDEKVKAKRIKFHRETSKIQLAILQRASDKYRLRRFQLSQGIIQQ